MARGKFVLAIAFLTIGGMASAQQVQYYPLPNGTYVHDVAPAADGTVWYTAQRQGALGLLDPKTGKAEHIPLGQGSAPHGVVVGPDGAPWITDSGQNAIVRVDPKTRAVTLFKLPENSGYANLNTAAFAGDGVLWFTGQNGVYGSVDPKNGRVKVYKASTGRGPYGITGTPSGEVYYSSLAGSYIARIDRATGRAEVIEPPVSNQGARRVWSDSKGRLWVSQWNSGNVSVYDPAAKSWKEWKLPGDKPQAYAVFVDDQDKVWLTDWTANAIVLFDPATETFRSFPSDKARANVRQILGRPGEMWGAESGTGRLVVIRTKMPS